MERKIEPVILVVREVADAATIVEIAQQPPLGWEETFRKAKHDLGDVSEDLLRQEEAYGPWYPAKKNVFLAFDLCPLDNVKVVIMGQDPYPTPNTAIGLAFATNKGQKVPVSLQNIYKDIAQSYPKFKRPNHGDLSPWALQGVLLLNACLTVRPGHPKSHGEVWTGFIKKVVRDICAKNPNCIFVLWGREAERFSSDLLTTMRVVRGVHPAERNGRFVGCGHFREINRLLIESGDEPIDWQL